MTKLVKPTYRSPCPTRGLGMSQADILPDPKNQFAGVQALPRSLHKSQKLMKIKTTRELFILLFKKLSLRQYLDQRELWAPPPGARVGKGSRPSCAGEDGPRTLALVGVRFLMPLRQGRSRISPLKNLPTQQEPSPLPCEVFSPCGERQRRGEPSSALHHIGPATTNEHPLLVAQRGGQAPNDAPEPRRGWPESHRERAERRARL